MSAPRWVVLVQHEDAASPDVYGAFKTREGALKEYARVKDALGRAHSAPEDNRYRVYVRPIHPGRVRTGHYLP